MLLVVTVLASLSALIAVAVPVAKALPSSVRFPRLRPLAQLVLPPKDLYVHLVEVPADLSLPGATFEFEFQHRYPGVHSIDLDVPEKPHDVLTWPGLSDIVLSVSCRDSSGREVAQQTKGGLPYWGQGEWGMSILRYEVPDQLGYHDRVRCKISSVTGGEPFAHAFPNGRFIVRKFSEE